MNKFKKLLKIKNEIENVNNKIYEKYNKYYIDFYYDSLKLDNYNKIIDKIEELEKIMKDMKEINEKIEEYYDNIYNEYNKYNIDFYDKNFKLNTSYIKNIIKNLKKISDNDE